MKALYVLIPIVAILLLLIAVHWRSSSPSVVEGELYASPAEDGAGYFVFKILKIDEGGFHVRMYSNVFKRIPLSIDEQDLYMAGMDRKPPERLGMGHCPIGKESFGQWTVHFIQKSTVTEDELEGYRMWQEAEGGYF